MQQSPWVHAWLEGKVVLLTDATGNICVLFIWCKLEAGGEFSCVFLCTYFSVSNYVDLFPYRGVEKLKASLNQC